MLLILNTSTMSGQNNIPMLFSHKGLVKIEKCPKCGSKRFNLIDFNRWFHCWECRHVCPVSEILDKK